MTTQDNIPLKNDINRGVQEGNEEMRPKHQGSEEEEEEAESLLQVPEMSDTSMDSVGQPLQAVEDQLNGPLDSQADGMGCRAGRLTNGQWLSQQESCSGGEEVDTPDRSQVPNAGFLPVLPAPADFYRFAPRSPDPASPGGSLYDSAEHGQQEAADRDHGDERDGREDEGAETKANDVTSAVLSKEDQERACPLAAEAGSAVSKEEEEVHRASPLDCSHPAEFRLDFTFSITQRLMWS